MKKLKFAVIGTGFWANYQIPAWLGLDGVELVALYNRTKSKAEVLAQKYHVPRVYDDVNRLLDNEQLDFIDIITDVDTHYEFTVAGAQRGVDVICQKPMAPKLELAKQMVKTCDDAGVRMFVHENWRWQSPIRKLKELIGTNVIGDIFKARVTFCSAFPVFDNQPFLAELDEFILTDIGSHILDVCRFLFGEVDFLHCHTATVNPTIKGEDVANVFMKMQNGVSCFAEMSYASILEREAFPQTFVLIEGSLGSIHLTHDFNISVTTKSGTEVVSVPPRMFEWVDPAYALVHSSIYDCNKNILASLQGTGVAETTAHDNLRTVELVHNAYKSARERRVISANEF